MPEIRKVSVALTGVIQDWQFKHGSRQEDIERLRQLWDEGKVSGPALPFDVERTLAAAQARLNDAVAE